MLVTAVQIHNLDDRWVTGSFSSPSQAGKVYVPGNLTSTLLRSERPFQSVSELQEMSFFFLICWYVERMEGIQVGCPISSNSHIPKNQLRAHWHLIDWIKSGTDQRFENESQGKLWHWGTNQCLMNICSCSCLFVSDSEQIYNSD